MEQKEILNELYDSALITTGAVGVSMIAKKAAGMPLSTPEGSKGTLKLGLAISLSSMTVKWAQEKKYLPVDPFSKSA